MCFWRARLTRSGRLASHAVEGIRKQILLLEAVKMPSTRRAEWGGVFSPVGSKSVARYPSIRACAGSPVRTSAARGLPIQLRSSPDFSAYPGMISLFVYLYRRQERTIDEIGPT